MARQALHMVCGALCRLCSQAQEPAGGVEAQRKILCFANAVIRLRSNLLTWASIVHFRSYYTLYMKK